MIEHDQSLKIFYVIENGYKAFLRYEIKDGRIDVLTTQVPKAVSGRGIAAKLMAAFVSYVRDSHLDFAQEISCSYARKYLEKNELKGENS